MLVVMAAVMGLLLVSALVYVSRSQGGDEPSGGVSQAGAITAARAHANGGATDVMPAEVRHNVTTPYGHAVPVHPFAWVVTFRGRWQLLCDGSTAACNPTSEWVAVDYYTGA
jgi:hypothetical protein